MNTLPPEELKAIEIEALAYKGHKIEPQFKHTGEGILDFTRVYDSIAQKAYIAGVTTERLRGAEKLEKAKMEIARLKQELKDERSPNQDINYDLMNPENDWKP